MKTYKKFIILIIALATVLSLSIIPASASWSTGYEVLDRVYFDYGLVTDDEMSAYKPLDTATKGEVSDLFARAFLGNPEANTSNLPHADEPASIAFITMAYEATTGRSISDVPFWRTISNGDYVARIEIMNLIVSTLLLEA